MIRKRWPLPLFALIIGCASEYPAVVALYQLELENKPADPAKVESVIKTIVKRVKGCGWRAPTIQRIGEDQIQVRIPGLEEEKWKLHREMIARWGRLELFEVASDDVHKEYADTKSTTARPGHKVLKNPSKRDLPHENLVVLEPAVVTDEMIQHAVPAASLAPSRWEIAFSLNAEGASRFHAATSRLASLPGGKHGFIAIVFEGSVASIPQVQSAIRDQGVIHGSYTQKEATGLALVLQAGSLAYPMKLVREEFPSGK